MFTIIFHRNENDNHSYKYPEVYEVYRASTFTEAQEVVRSCTARQTFLEMTDKINRREQYHDYGEWGFLILYKGYVAHTCYLFLDDGVEDYTYDKTSAKILEEIPDNKVWDAIIVASREHAITMHSKLTHFIKSENQIFHKIKATNELRRVEKMERERLKELLMKYPDMRN